MYDKKNNSTVEPPYMDANRHSKGTRAVQGRADAIEQDYCMFAGDRSLSGIAKAA